MGCGMSVFLANFRKIFDKNSTKKTAAEEACRDFDDSRDLIALEFEEKKEDIKHKVTEIHAVTSLKTKAVVKERNKAAIKKNSSAVHKFLGELVKIDFPGAKQVHEYSSKYGPELVSGPVSFVLEKVSIIITEEEEKAEAEAAAKEENEDGNRDREEIVEESRGEMAEESSKVEVEKQEKEEEMEPEKTEMVMALVEPRMIGGEAAAPAAAPPKA